MAQRFLPIRITASKRWAHARVARTVPCGRSGAASSGTAVNPSLKELELIYPLRVPGLVPYHFNNLWRAGIRRAFAVHQQNNHISSQIETEYVDPKCVGSTLIFPLSASKSYKISRRDSLQPHPQRRWPEVY